MLVKRFLRSLILLAANAVLLQFGGCVADVLSDVFFAVGPFLL